MSSNRVTATQSVATDLKVDASGVAVPVTDNGGSLTVDGAVTVSGTATVSGTVAVSSAPTTAITAAALPLPTGAATAALQPGLGTAGSANANVITVQGIASMTAVKVDGSAVTQPVSGTVTATGPLTDTQLRATAVPVSGTVTASGPLTDTQLRNSAVPVSLASAPSTAVTNAGTFAVQAAQSGTWTVQPGNTANTTPWMVGGKKVTISATLTRPNDTTAYAAGDSVSSSTTAPTIMTFTSCARASGGSGTIVRVLMTDSAYSATPGSFELWLLDTTMTPTNDNAAFAPSDADANTVVAIIPLAQVFAGTATAGTNGNMVYQSVGPFPFVTVGSANLFGIIVVRNAYTPIAVEAWVVRLIIEQD